MYVEDFDGRVGVMTQIDDLDAVAAALDRRGVRELALSTAIDKAYKYSLLSSNKLPELSFAIDKAYKYSRLLLNNKLHEVQTACTSHITVLYPCCLHLHCVYFNATAHFQLLRLQSTQLEMLCQLVLF